MSLTVGKREGEEEQWKEEKKKKKLTVWSAPDGSDN